MNITANTFRLDGRLALITGSSAGIGLALARGLGQAGAAVVLNGRDEARLMQAAAELRAEGLTVHTRGFDVTDHAAAAAAVQSIEAEIGPIEVLVNNAGIQRRGVFHEYQAEDWQALMRTNLDSVFHVGQAVARCMVPRGRGRIINIASVAGLAGISHRSAYNASKHGLIGLTQTLAAEWGGRGVRVNAIAPGPVQTDGASTALASWCFLSWWCSKKVGPGPWTLPPSGTRGVVMPTSLYDLTVPTFLQRAHDLQGVGDAVRRAGQVGLAQLLEAELVEPVQVAGDLAAGGVVEAFEEAQEFGAEGLEAAPFDVLGAVGREEGFGRGEEGEVHGKSVGDYFKAFIIKRIASPI